jgi:hypothetical protein
MIQKVGMPRNKTVIVKVLVFLEGFLEIDINICSRKSLVVAKESKNIERGNTKLERKG